MAKLALVTGATGGIGRAISRQLASRGYALQLHYNNNEQQAAHLQAELQSEYQIPCSMYQANLSAADGVDKLYVNLEQMPDIIIHNAGVAQYGLFTDITAQEYQEMVQLHLTSPFMFTQKVLPSMLAKRWGRIIFITSIWGETGASCESLYSMVKGGIISLTKSLAKELAPSGITVNAVSPGLIGTQMNASLTAQDLAALEEEIPLGRMGRPEEVAHAVHFLVEEASGYTTGQVLRVNGGWYT